VVTPRHHVGVPAGTRNLCTHCGKRSEGKRCAQTHAHMARTARASSGGKTRIIFTHTLPLLCGRASAPSSAAPINGKYALSNEKKKKAS